MTTTTTQSKVQLYPIAFTSFCCTNGIAVTAKDVHYTGYTTQQKGLTGCDPTYYAGGWAQAACNVIIVGV